jgi:hypothetical protein
MAEKAKYDTAENYGTSSPAKLKASGYQLPEHFTSEPEPADGSGETKQKAKPAPAENKALTPTETKGVRKSSRKK